MTKIRVPKLNRFVKKTGPQPAKAVVESVVVTHGDRKTGPRPSSVQIAHPDEMYFNITAPGSRQPTDTRIAFLDIETAPSLGWVWGKWEQNVIEFVQDSYLLSYSFKWAHQKGVKTRGLPDYPDTWKIDRKDDSALLRELWEDLDSADIIVAHNGDRFDLPTIYTRFVTLEMRPPSPSQTIDTLRWARNRFKFKSNKLDDLGRDLGIGRKLPHTGFHLWKGCMDGDLKSWHLMKRYNRRDVLLLEELYYRFLPWSKTHPNVNKGGNLRCSRCGSLDIMYGEPKFTALRKKEQIHCLNCGCWFEGSAKKP